MDQRKIKEEKERKSKWTSEKEKKKEGGCEERKFVLIKEETDALNDDWVHREM